MPDDPRITLIFDPFNICDGGEARVATMLRRSKHFRKLSICSCATRVLRQCSRRRS